jgi:DNA-binding transcriptional regulator YhcF (GntR family)
MASAPPAQAHRDANPIGSARCSAAILTKNLAVGERLPSLAELVTRYDVARMTIQQALRVLREENLIVSRQGSGVFVRERTARPVGLRPHIEAAFEQEAVKIDFSGYTAETLHNAIQEPLDKIREVRRPGLDASSRPTTSSAESTSAALVWIAALPGSPTHSSYSSEPAPCQQRRVR